jgi:hypothetical protein
MKVCRGGNLVPEGETEWAIPATAYGEAERACTESGGTVVDTSGGCGATESYAAPQADTQRGPQALTSGAFAAAYRLRESLAGTELVRDLDIVNNAEGLPEILHDDPALADHLAEGVGMAAGLAVDILLGGPAATFRYTQELHDWCVEIGRTISERLDDTDARDAIDRIAERMETFVDVPFSGVHRALLDEGRTATSA